MPINVEHRVPAGVLLQAAAQSGRAMGEAERVKEGRAARERQLEMLMKREESQQRTAMEGARLQAGMIEAQGRQRISQQQLELQSAELLQRQQFQAEQLENQKFAEIQDGIREGTLVYSPETQLELGNLDGRETGIMKDLALGPVGAATPERMAALDSIARLRRSLMSMPLPAPAPPQKVKGFYGDEEYGVGATIEGRLGVHQLRRDRSTRELNWEEVAPYDKTPEYLKAAQDSAERMVESRVQADLKEAELRATTAQRAAEQVRLKAAQSKADAYNAAEEVKRQTEITAYVDQAVEEATVRLADEVAPDPNLPSKKVRLPLSPALLANARKWAREEAERLYPRAQPRRATDFLSESFGVAEPGQPQPAPAGHIISNPQTGERRMADGNGGWQELPP